MHRFVSSAFVGLVAVVFAIAGCGGSAGGTAGGTSNATTPPPVPAVSDAGGSSSGGQAASAAPQASPGSNDATTGGTAVTCNQLTKADVQPLLVDPITTITVTAAGIGGEGQQCVFGTASDGAVDVLVLRGDEATSGYAQEVQGMTTPVNVAGIGDKAARGTGDDQPDSIKGDVFCAVSLGTDEGVPGVAALQQAAGGTSNIGEAANGIIAAALGTLCNRIYGSGNTTPDLSGLGSAAASPTSP
jgi:hypothetical protein